MEKPWIHEFLSASVGFVVQVLLTTEFAKIGLQNWGGSKSVHGSPFEGLNITVALALTGLCDYDKGWCNALEVNDGYQPTFFMYFICSTWTS